MAFFGGLILSAEISIFSVTGTLALTKVANAHCCSEAERAGNGQPGEEKTLGRHYCSLPVPKGDLQQKWGGTLGQGVE